MKNINNLHNLDYPEVRPLLDTKKQVVVHLEPNRIATIAGLFFTLIALFVFLMMQLSGYYIAIGTMVILCALIFVITYGISGILIYYGLLIIKTTQTEITPETEKPVDKTQD
ncbi:MAG: hypothetical protein ACP5UA_01440 [Candidatus Hydrogenedens sp.]